MSRFETPDAKLHPAQLNTLRPTDWRAGLAAGCGAATPWIYALNDYAGVWSLAAAGVGVVVCMLVLRACRSGPDLEAIGGELMSRASVITPFRAAVLAMLVAWTIAGGLFGGFPISDDIYAVLRQAETFASGRISVPAPPVPEAFEHPRFRIAHGVWISQYLPGWALFMTPLAALDLPFWLLPGLFAGGSVLVFWRLARRRFRRELAALATLSLVTSMFFVLNASTMFAHTATLFFGLVAFDAMESRRAGGGLAWALLAGVALGAMGAIRPFNAALFILLIGPGLLFDGLRERPLRAISSCLVFALGGLPFAGVLLGYQHLLTGSAMMTVTEWIGWKEPLGRISGNTFAFAVQRSANLALAASPFLACVAPVAAALLVWRKRARLSDFIYPLTLVAFLFYGGREGPSHGPRYLVEAYPFVVLSAAALVETFSRLSLVRSAVILHLAFQIAALASWIVIEAVSIWHVTEPFRLARQAGLHNAIVILAEDPGAIRRQATYDLTHNGIDVAANDVIWALDVPDGEARLRSAFPGRTLHVYRDHVITPLSPNTGD